MKKFPPDLLEVVAMYGNKYRVISLDADFETREVEPDLDDMLAGDHCVRNEETGKVILTIGLERLHRPTAPPAEKPQAKGGRARAEKLTPERRKEIARNAANVRYRKAKKPCTDCDEEGSCTMNCGPAVEVS